MDEKQTEKKLSYRQLAKKYEQLWEKLHNERIMWRRKCEDTRINAEQRMIYNLRSAADPVLAKMAISFGTPDENGEYKLELKVPKPDEGYYWTARIQAVDEDTRIVYASMEPYQEINFREIPEDPDKAEEEEEQ